MRAQDFLGEVTTSALDAKFGTVITEASAHRVAGYAPVETNTQLNGIWHGAASGILVETLGSIAATMHAGEIHPDQPHYAVGTELSVSHLRSTREGFVYAVAAAVHLGRTSATYLVTLTDESDGAGRVIATGRLSCRLLPVRSGVRDQ